MRIMTGNIIQHGGKTLSHVPIDSLDILGPNKDGTLNSITCAEGDYFALDAGAPVPYCQVNSQMVPGEKSSAAWQLYWSYDADNPIPILPAAIGKDGAYVGLYDTPGHTSQASYDPKKQKAFLIAQALQKMSFGHLHLVRQG